MENRILNLDTSLPVVEIFASIQGEGFNTGQNAIFLRLGKCNLRCPWCDTDFNKFKFMTLEEIYSEIQKIKNVKNVIITGGEPTIHKDLDLAVNFLKYNGYFVWIESNGLLRIPNNIDYIAISPKRLYKKYYEKRCVKIADEVRIVIDDLEEGYNFCKFIEKKVKAKKYYVSPCEINRKIMWEEAIIVLGRLNSRLNHPYEWLLSIQTHKLINIK